MKVFSFSIKPADKEAIELIAKVKHYCMRHGISFSSVVIKALTAHTKDWKL